MLVFILIFLFYVLLLFLLSLIFSINLCSVAFSSLTINFECGFYSIIISLLRYRFNYWLILFHFLIFEQELILALLLVYGIQTLNSNWIVIILYFILFIDLLFFILFIFIPSFYRIRTAFFFFLFSILGSINFIVSLFYLIFSISLFSLLIILPFLIKIPTFPFYYWLPEVHCEANTSISLFLAGLLLKLSIFGIIRFILSSYYLSLRFLSSIFIYITLIGVIIINCSYYRYFDLKKIIALSSILHLNLTFYSMLSLNSSGIFCAIIISLSHSLSSIGLFLFMGLLINKTNTRLLDSLFFISSILRLLLLFFLLANNSFPGSINFIGEILALLSIISIDALFCLFILFLSFLSIYFWFIVLNRKLPYYPSYLYYSYYFIYLLVFYLLVFIIYLLLF